MDADFLVRHSCGRPDVEAVGDTLNARNCRHPFERQLLGLHTLHLTAQCEHAIASNLQLIS
jgi:hypothetical protein